MTDELAEGLSEIGWARVQSQFPRVACRLIDAVSPDEMIRYRTPAQARKQLKKLQSFWGRLVAVCEDLSELREPEYKTVNHWSASSTELDNGAAPDRIATLIQSAAQMEPGLSMLIDELEDRAAKGTGKRPRNELAFEVADALMDVYLVGKGSLPTYGRQSNEKKVSGEYCLLLELLFARMELKVDDVVNVAETLIKPLKDNPEMTKARLDRIHKEQNALVQRQRNGRMSLPDHFNIEKAKQGI
ncbi:hypothetical protein [Yoonia litorea]|uniref:Uncharacterized protein n=1 Tax=Yoonia litorea TaxID=1123755 RepID=A0A1I6L4I7_9RHOB|nr:hypothetical protein [Yoonia litorea]SFR98403.1 hypothetical protein SAMN05444714_0177 [Yoonia litorea]